MINLLTRNGSVILTFALAYTLASCSTSKESKGGKDAVSASQASGNRSDAKAEDEELDSPKVSADRKLLVTSLSNNGFTSKAISRTKATELSVEFANSKSKETSTSYAQIVANRLAGKPATESFDSAQRILDQSISKNPDADLPESVQLELALSALQTNKLGLAEYFLQRLTKSKNNRIKVAAINALGVVAIRTDRIPEAVATFREALSVDGNYEPARLNIAFLALQGGDAGTAKQMLGGLGDDWFVESGLIGVERLGGDANKADQRCEKVLAKFPRHKPTLINCALNAYQGQSDFKKAREYLTKALQVPGGPQVWDDKSGRLLGVIDAEEARAANARAQREAEERKAKADQAKAAQDAAAAKANPEAK